MAKPNPKYIGEGNGDAPLEAGHRPCESCGRRAGAWTEPDEAGRRWTITLPHGADYTPGQRWTCRICERAEGHEDARAQEKTEEKGHPMPVTDAF